MSTADGLYAQGKGGGGAGGGVGQLARDCGDTVFAKVVMDQVLRYFTDTGEPYASLREGRWPLLASDVDAEILTSSSDCRPIVDAANPIIELEFGDGTAIGRSTLFHLLYEIGPYYVLVFGVVDAFGRGPMWILDSQTLGRLWVQGV